MKQLFTFLLVGFISFGAFAQNKVAKIEFKETVIDYGTIEKGADGKRTFEFTNVGDAPLIISNVKSTCGCTIPRWPKAPIMPGESEQIVVKYNTNLTKPIRKTITVFSNAETPTVALKIKGMVIAPSKEESPFAKQSKSIVEQK